MTKKEISIAFSNGEFESTYPFIAEDALWIVVEEDTFEDKQAIIENCKQVSGYFKSVVTNFVTINVIEENKNVVVSGTAEFSKDNNLVSFVSACDIYEFNDEDQIQKITSYCIQKAKV
jgi:hypothetical protein